MGMEDVYGQHGPIARSRRVCVDIQVPVHDLRSTSRRDADGNVKHHAEWSPNPQNPTGFDQVKRVDTQYANPLSDKGIPTPHTHEKTTPGGVRPATPDELPR